MNQISPQWRSTLRLFTIILLVCYPIFVGIAAAFKIGLPLNGSWAEVFYGPAITVVSYWLLFALGIWIEQRIRARLSLKNPEQSGPWVRLVSDACIVSVCGLALALVGTIWAHPFVWAAGGAVIGVVVVLWLNSLLK